MIKEMLCDIEGTLVTKTGNLHKHDLWYTRSLVNTMQRKGYRIGVITGRELGEDDGKSALSRYNQFEMNGPIIVENGSLILPDGWDLNEEVYSEFQVPENYMVKVGGLDSEQITSIKRFFQSSGLMLDMKFDPKKQTMVTVYMKNFPEQAFTDLSRFEWAKNMLPKYEVTYSSASIDVSTKGTNKGKAIKEYAKMKSLSLDEIAVFGDSKNDESMFRVVMNNGGLGFYVGEEGEMSEWIRKHTQGYFEKGKQGSKGVRHYMGKIDFFEWFSKHHRQRIREEGLC